MNNGDEPTIVGQWTGPYATDDHLVFTCGAFSGLTFPTLYWGCGTNAMHILGPHSRWNWDGGDTSQNVSLDTFIH